MSSIIDDAQNIAAKTYHLEHLLKSNPQGKDGWDEVFALINEIFEDFKLAHFPQVSDRHAAWEKFQALRDQTRLQRDQDRERESQGVYSDLKGQLPPTECGAIVEAMLKHLVEDSPFDFMAVKQDMIDRGQLLRDLKRSFSAQKRSLTDPHRDALLQEFQRIEQEHESFWEQYHQFREKRQAEAEAARKQREEERFRQQKEWELRKLTQEQKRAEWEEKQKAWRVAMYSKTERLRATVLKQEDFIRRMKEDIEKLKDSKTTADSTVYKHKVDAWIQEKEDKIKDAEIQIESMEFQITEIRAKLDEDSGVN